MSLPSSVSKLTALEELTVARVSAIPAEFWSLTQLKSLTLEDYPPASLTEGITGMSMLSDLVLWTMGSTLPGNIGVLRHLRVVKIGCMEAPLPESFGDLHCLEELRLSNCLFESFPESMAQLSSLRILQLIRCRRVETTPHWIGKLLQLRDIDLKFSSFPVLPSSLFLLPRLERLSSDGVGIVSVESHCE